METDRRPNMKKKKKKRHGNKQFSGTLILWFVAKKQ